MQDGSIDRTRLGIAVAATVGNAVSLTPAVHATFGVFLAPLSRDFGWPRASISVVLGILAVSCALLYPVVGRYADRHGAKRVILVGNVGLAVGIALLALSNGSLARFYLTFVMIAIFSALPSSVMFSKVISDWFDRNRGVMQGISAGGGNGVGSMAMPIVAAALLTLYGWRGAYAGVAAIVFFIGFPVLVLGLRDAPRYVDDDGHAPTAAGLTLAEAARIRSFWLILVAIALAAGCLTAIFSHVVPILADRGFSLATGTAVISLFALVTAGWQIATGALLDRSRGPRVVTPMVLCAVAGLALLELGSGGTQLVLAGVLLGIGLGSQYGAMPVFVARYFGLRAFGSIIGIMYSAVILAQGATPILLDHAFDVQGTYRFAVAIAGALLGVAALLLLLLPAFVVPATRSGTVPVHI